LSYKSSEIRLAYGIVKSLKISYSWL
jgi:hypothetical protein